VFALRFRVEAGEQPVNSQQSDEELVLRSQTSPTAIVDCGRPVTTGHICSN
jgi:hypothetical protein